RSATDVPKTAAYQTTSRKLALRRNLRGCTQAVSRAAHRVQQRPVESPVDLGAEPADVGLDHAGAGVEVKLPYVFEEHGARHDLSRVVHQVLQQPEFLRLHLDTLAAARDRALEAVQLEVSDTQHRLALGDRRPARERVHAGQELGESEWLDEIVIGPCLQPLYAVIDAAQ